MCGGTGRNPLSHIRNVFTGHVDERRKFLLREISGTAELT